MAKFKNIRTGAVIEVPEDHAEQVLRKQRGYVEVGEDEEVQADVIKPKRKQKG
jgi:hypothetical protein